VSVPTYQSYQDSGVEWLGKVPSHWTVDRLKASVAASKGGIWGDEADGGDDDIACIRVADFDRSRLSVSLSQPTIRKVAKKDRNGRLVHRGDLLLEKSGGGEKQPVGFVALYDHDLPAVCSNFVARMELKAGMYPSFWRYVHAAVYARGITVRSLNQSSGIQNLDQDRYLQERAPFPPHEEQAAIADFLDRETAKIDPLVESQRRLIELLKEKRQAVISHAFTKGIALAAPMKDSGVEWLGNVPLHWEVRRLSTEADFFQGKAHEPFIDDDGEHVCVTARFVSTSGEAQKNCSVNLSPADYADILMVMSDLPGGRALARTFLVEDKRSYAVNQRVCSIRFRYGDPRFFAHQLNRNNQLLIFDDGVEQTHLKNSAFTKLLLAIPPADEQSQIADWLDRQILAWDRLKEEAELAIHLLLERRAALISAAVTGKIYVLKPASAEANRL
jgi:type I restriction enzyme S subunit